MAKNFYFENYTNSGEQSLIEDLVIESIRIYGIDTYYITRSSTNLDPILIEDDLPIYNEAHSVEMYVKNVDGFEGEGDFLSKFGLQIRDSMTMTVSIRQYEQEVARYNNTARPKEGDLLYFPLNNKIFKIMHVEHESIFYQMGDLQVYDLRCELFEYSNERFETGRDNIDNYWNSVTTASTATNPVTTLEGLEEVGTNIIKTLQGARSQVIKTLGEKYDGVDKQHR